MPINLTNAMQALNDRAARTALRVVRTSQPRKDSIAKRFLADLTADAIAQGITGAPLPLAFLTHEWCAANYPSAPGRLTPDATLEAQLRVAAKAGALPAHVVITSAKENATAGRPHAATITIEAPAAE